MDGTKSNEVQQYEVFSNYWKTMGHMNTIIWAGHVSVGG
jgi:hypothetical protein